METVVLQGVTYTKAATVAKQFGYTSDYVGQLCRSKKVDCELVGRSWFVSAASVKSYRDGRYQSKEEEGQKTADEATSEVPIRKLNATNKNSGLNEKSNNSNVKFSHDDEKYKVAINPRTPKNELKRQREPSNFAERISWSKAVYQPDDDSLLPPLVKKDDPEREAVSIDVNPAESKRISVAAEGESATLEATELPKIPLTGTLHIKSFDSKDPENNDQQNSKITSKNKDFSQSSTQLRNPSGIISMTKKAPQRSFTPASVRERSGLPVAVEEALSEQPAATTSHVMDTEGQPVTSDSGRTVWRFVPSPFISVLLGLIAGCVVAFLVVTVEERTIAEAATSHRAITFDLSFLEAWWR